MRGGNSEYRTIVPLQAVAREWNEKLSRSVASVEKTAGHVGSNPNALRCNAVVNFQYSSRIMKMLRAVVTGSVSNARS